MSGGAGGRITLRLAGAGGSEAVYEGTATDGAGSTDVAVVVALADGTVTLRGAARPPAWLEEFLRATLRAAWRANRTGVPWPRRVSRWRARPDGTDESS